MRGLSAKASRITPAHHLRGAAKNTNPSATLSSVSNQRKALRATSGACASYTADAYAGEQETASPVGIAFMTATIRRSAAVHEISGCSTIAIT